MIKKLQQYKELKTQIEKLEERIARLENSMLSPRIGNISGMPGGSSHEIEHLTENLVRLEELRVRCSKLIFKLSNLQIEIEERMKKENLKDSEKDLIRLKYFKELPWWKISKALGYGQRQVYNIHKKILKKF